MHKIAQLFKFIHKEIALKRPSTYIILFYTKSYLKKKLKQNLLKIYTKTHQICTFFQNFLTWQHDPSMCAADIIIFI